MSTPPARRRVLVIDDDMDCADTIAMILRRLGVEVTVAYSGAAGLDAFAAFSPDLIFLDIGMPHMDGYQTVRELRARPTERDVKIVALTGWGRSEDRARTLAAGFDHHLVKPAEMADLRDMLQN